MYPDIDGSTLIVTGASQGIGAAIARRFGAAGANVVVHYRSGKAPAEAVAAAIVAGGGNAVTLSAELDKEADVRRLFATAADTFGRIDTLVNNAGSFPNAALLDMSLDDWRRMYADNVESTFLCTQAAGRAMQGDGGAIVNVTSISALNPGNEHAHYNSAKAAVGMLTRSAAQELGRFGIRVNAVAPGLVYRPGLEDEWPAGYARYCKASPLSSVVQPEDVADACLFLASASAARISGATLPVDAGVLSASIY